MRLDNPTPLPASLSRSALLYRDLSLATVVVKASYEVAEDGSARLLEEQLPINDEDATTPFGTIDADVTPVKDGCDLGLMGKAFSPRGRPTTRMEVAVDLGDWHRRMIVFGDRTWRGTGAELQASAPTAFVEMPLTYERAYGGLASTGEMETGYDDNPEGRGFVYLEKEAAGTSLPNLEESDQLIRTWRDRPMPAGLAPLPRQSAIRLQRGADVDLENGVTRVLPAMFSWSHPRMRLERYPEGAPMRVQGMRPQGDWKFALPPWHAAVGVRLGSRREFLPLKVDTICAFPEFNRFLLVARCSFVYQFVARRERVVSVHWRYAPPLTNPPSIEQCIQSGDTTVILEPGATDSPIPFDLMRELHPLTRIVESLPIVVSS